MDSNVKLLLMTNFHMILIRNSGLSAGQQKTRSGYYCLKKHGQKYMAVIKELKLEQLEKHFHVLLVHHLSPTSTKNFTIAPTDCGNYWKVPIKMAS